MEDFRKYFEGESQGRKVPDLREIYKMLRGKEEYTDLPAETTGAAMAAALHDWETTHPKSLRSYSERR